MGEAKLRRQRLSPVEEAALRVTHDLADKGRLIAGGFAAYIRVGKISIADQRLPLLHDAYMAGAEHLWSSMMVVLDPGTDPTSADLQRLTAVHREIEAWRDAKNATFAKAMKTEGSA